MSNPFRYFNSSPEVIRLVVMNVRAISALTAQRRGSVTHHALSRLAQRCGARTPADLLNGVGRMWNAVVDLINTHGHDGWLNPP